MKIDLSNSKSVDKLTLILLLAFSYLVSSQEKRIEENYCTSSVFYELALDRASEDDTKYMVNFDYQLSDFTKESVFKSSLLSDEEKEIVIYELSQNHFDVPCETFRNKLEILESRPLDKKSRYTKVHFSKPIYVSKQKVFLFSEAVILEENVSRVFGGGLMLYVFAKEGGSWVVSEKNLLEMY